MFLQVAYVSQIMSKTFRKEGQPEKERIAKITGMDIDKAGDIHIFIHIFYISIVLVSLHVHTCNT